MLHIIQAFFMRGYGLVSKKNYIFGPVPSRRLGFSLGVDLLPFKACTLDCLYCQLAKTTDKAILRKSYFPAQEIIQQLKEKLALETGIDYITISGSGEPTLSADIGKIITAIKEITDIPVAVITNSTLLYRLDVKEDLKKADVLIPSMDAVTEDVLRKINRPHAELNIRNILAGLLDLKNWFKGEVRLEIMFMAGMPR